MSAQDEHWKALAHLLLAAWESEDPRDHHDDCESSEGDECTCARPEVRQHAHAMLANEKVDPGNSERLFELYYAPVPELEDALKPH